MTESTYSGNLFADLPSDLPNEDLTTLASSDAFQLVRIVSTGQATPPDEWYDQDEAEWVMVLSGRAGLKFENEDTIREMGPGDYVLIPPHARHRVEWTADDEPTVWLALHYKG